MEHASGNSMGSILVVFFSRKLWGLDFNMDNNDAVNVSLIDKSNQTSTYIFYEYIWLMNVFLYLLALLHKKIHVLETGSIQNTFILLIHRALSSLKVKKKYYFYFIIYIYI